MFWQRGQARASVLFEYELCSGRPQKFLSSSSERRRVLFRPYIARVFSFPSLRFLGVRRECAQTKTGLVHRRCGRSEHPTAAAGLYGVHSKTVVFCEDFPRYSTSTERSVNMSRYFCLPIDFRVFPRVFENSTCQSSFRKTFIKFLVFFNANKMLFSVLCMSGNLAVKKGARTGPYSVFPDSGKTKSFGRSFLMLGLIFKRKIYLIILEN